MRFAAPMRARGSTGARLTYSRGKPLKVAPSRRKRRPPLVLYRGVRDGTTRKYVPYYTPPYSKTTKIKSVTVEASLGGGSTKTTYTQGRKRMSRQLYNLFKTNQDWVNSSSLSLKLDNNNYGQQSVNYFNCFSNANFGADANLCAGTTLTTDQINTTELYYGTFRTVATFTNAEVTTSYLTIYEISPRFHMTIESTYGPNIMWRSGLDASYGSTIPNAHYKVYNKPFDSPYFTHLYRVKKIYNIAIGPGASHEHVSTYHINKNLYGFITYPFEINRIFSNMQMYVIAGSPINDATTNTLVSTSTVSLNVVMRATRNFTYAPQARTRYNYTDSLGTIASANVISDVAKIADAEA